MLGTWNKVLWKGREEEQKMKEKSHIGSAKGEGQRFQRKPNTPQKKSDK